MPAIYRIIRRKFVRLPFGNWQKTPTHRPQALSAYVMQSDLKVTFNNIRSLEDTQHLLNAGTLSQCAGLLVTCRTILLFGTGSSLCVAKDTYLKFLRMNKPCIVNEDWHSQLLQAKNSSSEDAAIIFSYGGQTKEMIECMKILKKNGTPCIAVTRYALSSIAKLADYCLYTAANETLFRNGAMSSRLSQLNVVDISFTVIRKYLQ